MVMDLPQDRFTSVNGVRTRYWAEGGKGSPVVLVHGLGGFVETWMHNIRPLAANHRVYAMDLLGFGQSDKTPLVRDLNLLVRFINDFLENLQIQYASFIGNSLGGGLVLQYTLDYPQKVEKLVLVDNAGMGRELCADFRFCVLPVINSLFLKQGQNSPARMLDRLVYDPSVITGDFQDFTLKYNSADGAGKALFSVLSAGVNIFGQKRKLTRQLLNRLHAVKAPTLVIWGKQDRVIPVAHADIAVKNIPGARLELFDNCGHMPMFEQPEKFNRLVLDFLNKNG